MKPTCSGTDCFPSEMCYLSTGLRAEEISYRQNIGIAIILRTHYTSYSIFDGFNDIFNGSFSTWVYDPRHVIDLVPIKFPILKCKPHLVPCRSRHERRLKYLVTHSHSHAEAIKRPLT